jgi:hypothetical protein
VTPAPIPRKLRLHHIVILKLYYGKEPRLCDHYRLICLPEPFNVHQEDESIIREYIRNGILPELPNLQKDAASHYTFCTELKKRISAHEWPDNARDITIGSAILLPESM